MCGAGRWPQGKGRGIHGETSWTIEGRPGPSRAMERTRVAPRRCQENQETPEGRTQQTQRHALLTAMWLCEDIPRWTGIDEIGGPRYVSGVGQNQVLSCASPAAPASDAVASTGIWAPNWRRLAGTGIAQRALLGTLRGGPCCARTALYCACYVPRWAARRYRSPGAGGLRPT